jgi:PKHD-type hydroxylase
MLLHIPGVLRSEQLQDFRQRLEKASWADGRHSAGYLSQGVKNNNQLADADPTGISLGNEILDALDGNPEFTSAALPHKIVSPLFNRYGDNQDYGRHIDGAIRPVGDGRTRVRTDISATLFLSASEDYDGGDLVIEDTYGPRRIKLAAGDMVLYPGTSVHHVEPVTRGTRLAAFFWIQSMVRNDADRTLLFQLDKTIQSLAADHADHPALTDLAGVYHNLMRRWADA